jgi:hypothetical protein
MLARENAVPIEERAIKNPFISSSLRIDEITKKFITPENISKNPTSDAYLYFDVRTSTSITKIKIHIETEFLYRLTS